MGLSRLWLLAKVKGSNYADTVAVRLALLTAWAAFTASKHVANWLAENLDYSKKNQWRF